MASPQHSTTMENLPDELLSHIFIRLFAKQLARMRSVSKSWNALLSQSSFIKSHLHHSIHNNNQILLVFYYYFGYFLHFKPFTTSLGLSPHIELTNFIKLPVYPRREYTEGIRHIGSIIGLICSGYGDSVIHIWNPSLSAVLTLPPYSMPSCDGYSLQTYFRFGFDPKTNDYKVVKLMGYRGLSPLVVKWWLQVEVFCMRKGLWESITERFPSHITRIYDDKVCVDGNEGHLCWLGHGNEESDTKTIVAFDLGSGTFSEIPLPYFILNNYNHRFNKIGVLAGKHCLMTRIGVDGFDVWVMEEYGVVESWVQRHVFSQLSGNIVHYGFTSHNGFLLYDIGRLVLYDPIANKTEILENFHSGPPWIDKIVEYVDSLVWVAPATPKMVDV